MNQSLDELQRHLRYEFRDTGLLQTALTHRSRSAANYERLEFLGDAILGFVVAEMLYARFHTAPEGQLSRFRAALVNKQTLSELARELSLGDHLLLGSGELKSGGFRRDSILADAFEAMIGALYLDGGMAVVRDFIKMRIDPRLDDLMVDSEMKDPKTRLQEYLQHHALPLPEYRVIDTSGDEHDQTFLVECVISCLDVPATGNGTSRRRAEQAAAEQALSRLGVSP